MLFNTFFVSFMMDDLQKLQFFRQFAAETFVAMHNVFTKQRHEHHLKHKIHQRQVQQQEQDEERHAEVERQQSVIGEHRQGAIMEFLTESGRNVLRAAVFLFQHRQKALEVRGFLFLLLRVVDITSQEEFPEEVAFPRSIFIGLLLLRAIVQFASLLSFQKEKMHLNVVVRHA